jgi:hypothetical protein
MESILMVAIIRGVMGIDKKQAMENTMYCKKGFI